MVPLLSPIYIHHSSVSSIFIANSTSKSEQKMTNQILIIEGKFVFFLAPSSADFFHFPLEEIERKAEKCLFNSKHLQCNSKRKWEKIMTRNGAGADWWWEILISILARLVPRAREMPSHRVRAFLAVIGIIFNTSLDADEVWCLITLKFNLKFFIISVWVFFSTRVSEEDSEPPFDSQNCARSIQPKPEEWKIF